MELKTFADVKNHLLRKNRVTHLLLGNGFSMAYNDKMFSYNALSRLVEDSGNEMLKALFERTKTKNFEIIMGLLEEFIRLSDIFGIDEQAKSRIKQAHQDIQKSLVDAITQLHPEYVLKISEAESKRCFDFLSQFLARSGNVFTTNYDLLLYWVLMRHMNAKTNTRETKESEETIKAVDGFSRDISDIDYSDKVLNEELRKAALWWGRNKSSQNIHYLHGALPLFSVGAEIIKEEYDGFSYILDNIKARIDKKQYPIFVTAGDGSDKMRQIMYNRYLSFCYERLSEIEGSLITYGFGFGEYDEHIIEAINKASNKGKSAQLRSVYIGVFGEENRKYIESIENKFVCKVYIYDAKIVNIWRDSE